MHFLTTKLSFCPIVSKCHIVIFSQGICDQKCRNTPGSYECLCDHKYILQEDKRTCKGGDAMLIFSTKKHIRGYLLQSKLYFPLVKNLNQAIGVAYDGHFIYWTDISGEQESIMRMGEVGKRIEVGRQFLPLKYYKLVFLVFDPTWYYTKNYVNVQT